MIDGDADGLALGSQAYDAALACSSAHREQISHLESRAYNDRNRGRHSQSGSRATSLPIFHVNETSRYSKMMDLGLRLDYYMLLHRWMWIDCILLIASAEHNRLTHEPPTSSFVATATPAGWAMSWMPVGFHVR